MNKHTPGPWRVDKIFGLIMGAKGEEIAAIHSGTEEGRQNLETSNYNARLIAAAPEMLDVLKQARHRLYKLQDIGAESQRTLELIEAVIAKAEGQNNG